MERNINIDYFRFILCLLVIPIHTQPLFRDAYLAEWLIVNGVSRIVVPCFFIISGFYIHTKLDDKKKIQKYVLHCLMVYIAWSLIYLPVYYETTYPRTILLFMLTGFYHLWFVPALMVGVIMLAIAKKTIKNDNIILISGIVLFLIGYIMENAGFPYRLFCNGVFFGYPLLSLGYYVQRTDLTNKIKSNHLYILLVISVVLVFLESYLNFTKFHYCNLFVTHYLLCPLLLMYVLRRKEPRLKINNLGKIASGVYYVHVLVTMKIILLDEFDNIYKLPLIAAVSVLLAIFAFLINKRVKILL